MTAIKADIMNKSADKSLEAAPRSIPPSSRTLPCKEYYDADHPEEPFINENEPKCTIDSTYDALGNVDWYQFEKFCAALLRNEGYTVERKGGAHPDGGVDLIATKGNETTLVQCKHWKTWEIKPKTVSEDRVPGNTEIYWR